MGQATSPITARAGYSQLYDNQLMTKIDYVRYPQLIRVFRLFATLIKYFYFASFFTKQYSLFNADSLGWQRTLYKHLCKSSVFSAPSNQTYSARVPSSRLRYLEQLAREQALAEESQNAVTIRSSFTSNFSNTYATQRNHDYFEIDYLTQLFEIETISDSEESMNQNISNTQDATLPLLLNNNVVAPDATKTQGLTRGLQTHRTTFTAKISNISEILLIWLFQHATSADLNYWNSFDYNSLKRSARFQPFLRASAAKSAHRRLLLNTADSADAFKLPVRFLFRKCKPKYVYHRTPRSIAMLKNPRVTAPRVRSKIRIKLRNLLFNNRYAAIKNYTQIFLKRNKFVAAYNTKQIRRRLIKCWTTSKVKNRNLAFLRKKRYETSPSLASHDIIRDYTTTFESLTTTQLANIFAISLPSTLQAWRRICKTLKDFDSAPLIKRIIHNPVFRLNTINKITYSVIMEALWRDAAGSLQVIKTKPTNSKLRKSNKLQLKGRGSSRQPTDSKLLDSGNNSTAEYRATDFNFWIPQWHNDLIINSQAAVYDGFEVIPELWRHDAPYDQANNNLVGRVTVLKSGSWILFFFLCLTHVADPRESLKLVYDTDNHEFADDIKTADALAPTARQRLLHKGYPRHITSKSHTKIRRQLIAKDAVNTALTGILSPWTW